MIVLLATACQKSSGPRGRPVETSGPVVATFGDHKMTTAELQRDFSEQSAFVRSHYQTLERKREFLEVRIQDDLLDDEGLKAGFDKDDEVQDDCKKAVIEQWIRRRQGQGRRRACPQGPRDQEGCLASCGSKRGSCPPPAKPLKPAQP